MTVRREELLADAVWDGATVEHLDCTGAAITEHEFRRCVFDRVRLVEADLGGSVFEDCELVQCDLTMAKVERTAFRGVRFRRCKLMGIDWSPVRSLVFTVTFEGCVLTHSSFVGNKMRGTRFLDCQATETTFVDVDLSEAVFTGSDLAGAKFIDTTLIDADLSTATNYAISPQQNRLKRTRFSEEAALALVSELGIVVPRP